MAEEKRTRKAKELWDLEWEYSEENHEVEVVDRKIDNGWRHGNDITVVVKETFPDASVAFWRGQYRESGDGEYNSWREGVCLDFVEVFPKLVTIQKIVYE